MKSEKVDERINKRSTRPNTCAGLFARYYHIVCVFVTPLVTRDCASVVCAYQTPLHMWCVGPFQHSARGCCQPSVPSYLRLCWWLLLHLLHLWDSTITTINMRTFISHTYGVKLNAVYYRQQNRHGGTERQCSGAVCYLHKQPWRCPQYRSRLESVWQRTEWKWLHAPSDRCYEPARGPGDKDT